MHMVYINETNKDSNWEKCVNFLMSIIMVIYIICVMKKHKILKGAI